MFDQTKTDDWLLIKDLAKRAGVGESTARRYIEQFGDFLPVRTSGRGVRGHPDCIKVIARIYALKDSYSDLDIQDILAKEFPRTFNVEDEPHHAVTTPSPVPVTKGEMAQFLVLLRQDMEIRDERIKEVILESQEKAMEEIKKEIQREAAEIRAVHERVIKERDRQVMEAIRELQKPKGIVVWLKNILKSDKTP